MAGKETNRGLERRRPSKGHISTQSSRYRVPLWHRLLSALLCKTRNEKMRGVCRDDGRVLPRTANGTFRRATSQANHNRSGGSTARLREPQHLRQTAKHLFNGRPASLEARMLRQRTEKRDNALESKRMDYANRKEHLDKASHCPASHVPLSTKPYAKDESASDCMLTLLSRGEAPRCFPPNSNRTKT